MSTSVLRRLAAGLAVAGLLLAFPGAASATVSGGCTVLGDATSGGIDITTEPVWHLRSTDAAGGSGVSPGPMTSATLSAYALGFAIPIASGTGKGDTSGSVDDVSLSTFSKLGRVFVVAGSASGPGGSCDGQILIIIDDVEAMFTILGGGGLIVFILGIAASLLTGRGGGCLSKMLAFVFGGIAATGLGLSLAQFEIISPTSPIGLVIVLVGAILGFLVALRIGPPGMSKSPPPPAVAAAVGTPPSDASKAAIDAADDTPPDMVAGTVTGGVGSTPNDVGQGAADLLGEAAGGPPEPDPNAPGVDVSDPEK
jgi:hypothetical protein